MKKEMIIVFILLVIVFTLSFLLQKYTSKSIKETTKLLNEISNITIKLIDKENPDFNIEQVDKIEEKNVNEKFIILEDKWNIIDKNMSFYLEHDELEKVNNLMTTIKKNIEIKEYNDATRDIEECIFVLNHINDKLSLKLKNLF